MFSYIFVNIQKDKEDKKDIKKQKISLKISNTQTNIKDEKDDEIQLTIDTIKEISKQKKENNKKQIFKFFSLFGTILISIFVYQFIVSNNNNHEKS